MDVHCDGLDLVPFFVGFDVNDDGLSMRSILVIHLPPEKSSMSDNSSVLSTEKGYKLSGFGTAVLKVALLYIKEHQLSPNLRVLADTLEDGVGRSAINYWKNIGFAFCKKDKVVTKEGDSESVCL